LLMFSIDGLVGINREFGASVGDNVLNAFANKLRKIFQDQEPIRWSGNEFVVVLPDHTVTAARGLAEEVLSLVERRKFRLLETGEWIGTVTGSASIVSDQG
ncbi:GGDEF domain-containing protein, partial [Streptococcus suis]